NGPMRQTDLRGAMERRNAARLAARPSKSVGEPRTGLQILENWAAVLAASLAAAAGKFLESRALRREAGHHLIDRLHLAAHGGIEALAEPRCACDGQAQQVTQLVYRETDGTALPQIAQPRKHLVGIATPTPTSGGAARQQTDSLVVADGIHGNPGSFRELPDGSQAHGGTPCLKPGVCSRFIRVASKTTWSSTCTPFDQAFSR